MNIFLEYLKLSLWLFPPFFFVISLLHFRKKIKPNSVYGYSAKGQLMMGVAFTCCASSFLFPQSGVSIALMLGYCVILIWAARLEKRAKKMWQSSQN
ncbi:hypothetical protein [Vibrio parahaemolyticus]|uniref:hypothetical protein n=1 Tax=Vibrio parahaemolyticus TaxID=670 RepID=UPI001122AB4D|nr:hypothetical protein [Vibrio parahaemolyticus]ELA9815315.1 hypothetical protein [Vibrio parahaemolyticus]ELA9890099.1 hypothetical protein [Vibrio parahaemolyticus]TOG32982.1 hypothetical protein CGJ03_23615 [Vibrio parahaemolyticus]HCH3500938.1 hypothetical protein [Vibrio parahaemolyticus]